VMRALSPTARLTTASGASAMASSAASAQCSADRLWRVDARTLVDGWDTTPYGCAIEGPLAYQYVSVCSKAKKNGGP